VARFDEAVAALRHRVAILDARIRDRWRPGAQRAAAAFLAMAVRRIGVSFAALALPPLRPPSRPRVTAAGFFFWAP
jgi:hypothetical protein